MSYVDQNLHYRDSAAYDERIKDPLEHYVWRVWDPILRQLIKQYVKRGTTVADLGAGTLEHTQHMNEAALVYVVEREQSMTERGRSKLQSFRPKVHILHEDALHTSIPSASCDVVWSVGLSEYVDLEALFQEITRICKEGGHIIIQFPNRHNPHNAVALLTHRVLRRHTKAYRARKDFEEIARRYHLDIEKKISRGVFAYVPSPLQRFFIPVWRAFDVIYAPFQSIFPLGVNIMLVMRRSQS